ncbi:hypothetical protein [Noviluteimonas dokdonensis]|uniref:hypothetical protein n=1 Tax=Noviluteimonas dokdonensis TaxID=414050 RepID=UPI00056CF18F|nr:hypothetical protein [Lysobacter dokdonensis]
MTRRARHRLRIALLAVFCLLFQQAALAAYLCPLEQMPAEMTGMAEHCAEMGMEQARDNPALCEKHCNPEHSVAADLVKLSVPSLALPASTAIPVVLHSTVQVAVQADVPISRSDPPPRLRFCSLLI